MANKYGAIRTYSELCGRVFDSKAECRRGEELALLERAGEIFTLEYQVRFMLSEVPKVSLTVDFSYRDKTGQEILEDTKGIETREFRVKRLWLKEKFGKEILLTR